LKLIFIKDGNKKMKALKEFGENGVTYQKHHERMFSHGVFGK